MEELEQDFRAGVDEYLEICTEKGIKPQKSFTGTFNIRIPSETHGMAVVKAKELGINLNTFVKNAIEDKLKCYGNITRVKKRETNSVSSI